MIAAIFSHALRDYLRLRKTVPWLLLGLACLGLAAVWSKLDRSSTGVDQYASVSSILVFHLVALASAIFSTAIVSQEVEGKTIVYLLTRPVPRWQLIVFRYAASVIVVALIGVVAALLTSIGAFGLNFGANHLLAKDLLALALGSMAYGSLFLFVSLLFNRSLIICALFAFGWESSVPSLPGDLYRLSIYSYLQAIADHPTSEKRALALLDGSDAIDNIPNSQAFMILAGVVVFFLAASAWWFTHFEFVPREDAE